MVLHNLLEIFIILLNIFNIQFSELNLIELIKEDKLNSRLCRIICYELKSEKMCSISSRKITDSSKLPRQAN